MKKNITIALLAAGVIILLYFLLNDKPQPDTHKSEHSFVAAMADTVKAHDAISARIIDSLKQNISQQGVLIIDLTRAQEQTESKLNNKASEVRMLVAQIKGYNQDTGYFGRLLDSLQNQVESLNFLLVKYEQYGDSLNTANLVEKENYEAIIREKDKTKAELQSAYDQLSRLYDALYKDHQQGGKQLRREKLKTKIASILGLLALGAAALK